MAADAESKHYNIQIDRQHYKVEVSTLTGAEIRQLPQTPIGPDRDLFEVVPGGSPRNIPTCRRTCGGSIRLCASRVAQPSRTRTCRSRAADESGSAGRDTYSPASGGRESMGWKATSR